MMDGALLVFIDSLPFSCVPRMDFVAGARVLCELTPGFGYSSNLLPELFSGQRPDDLGFFCEWGYAPAQSEFARVAWLLPLLDRLCAIPSMERVIRRLLREAFGPTFKIPLRYLDRFARASMDVYAPDFPFPTIFHSPGLVSVLPYAGVSRQRDEAGCVAARQQIDAHHQVFVALPDLDSYGHLYGTEAPEYERKVLQLDTWLRDLCEGFLHRYSNGRVIVVSDHGMANVERGYRLTIEDQVGPSDRDKYTYFIDSTLLRVWIHDAGLYWAVGDYLDGLAVGALVSSDQREQYGIRSRAFGDFILVLNEGLVFHPSSLSNKVPKGMHGYHPELPSQKGVFAAFGAPLPGDAFPRTNIEVADILMSIL